MTDEDQHTNVRLRISQETIAIVTVGIALAGLNLVTTGDLRGLRNEWQAQSRQLRNEARADREKLSNEARADREGFQREILRLTQGQAELAAIVASTQPKSE